MVAKELSRSIEEWYNDHEHEVRTLMHDIWEHPELGLQEHYAARATAEFARKFGFELIELHAAEDFNNPEAEPNSVIATYGSGKPVIAIVGELDALPDIGNDAVPYRSEIKGPGHACGHNLMAGGAAGAACAVLYAMKKEGISGTLKLIETPAEEIGCGKALLAQNGVFDGLDMALMWHTLRENLIIEPLTPLTILSVLFEFHGKAAHAAGAPWDGKSALDAVQLMNMGCEFMREHMRPNHYMHYCISNGGSAPNIVPDYSSVKYIFRAPDNTGNVMDLFKRALDVAKGAALMTGATVDYQVQFLLPYFYENLPLCKFLFEIAQKLPPVHYTDEEYEFARKLYECIAEKDAPDDYDAILPSKVSTEFTGRNKWILCTDAADITHFCPTAHLMGLGVLSNSPGHHWSTSATSGMAIGEKAGVFGYRILAEGAYQALQNPELVRECWDYFRSLPILDYKTVHDWEHIG